MCKIMYCVVYTDFVKSMPARTILCENKKMAISSWLHDNKDISPDLNWKQAKKDGWTCQKVSVKRIEDVS